MEHQIHGTELFYFATLPLKVLSVIGLFTTARDQAARRGKFKFPTYY